MGLLSESGWSAPQVWSGVHGTMPGGMSQWLGCRERLRLPSGSGQLVTSTALLPWENSSALGDGRWDSWVSNASRMGWMSGAAAGVSSCQGQGWRSAREEARGPHLGELWFNPRKGTHHLGVIRGGSTPLMKTGMARLQRK